MPLLQPIFGPLNLLDCTLAALLVGALPFIQLRASLWRRSNRTLVQRYERTMLFMGAPLILLAADWLLAGRAGADLGLAIPLPFRGEMGLVVALVVLIAVVAWPRPKGAKADALRKQMKQSGMMIATPAELGLFLPLALLVGCGTELLFRGFLLWALAPFTGTAGAVVIAAFAYGLGQGFASRKQLAGNVISAFIFTIAYAATESLWWLMLIHTGMMLHGGWTGYRLAHERPA